MCYKSAKKDNTYADTNDNENYNTNTDASILLSMPNLFRHLRPIVKIPICIGMTFFVMLNLFQHLFLNTKDSDMRRNDFFVMPNLFRHLRNNDKIPSRWLSGCIGMMYCTDAINCVPTSEFVIQNS